MLNLVSADLAGAVDKLALMSGSVSLPPHKKLLGYRSERDKFSAAGLTQQASELVRPPRVQECKIQMEARVATIARFGANDPRMSVPACAIEVTIARIHAIAGLRMDAHPNCIDPDKWRPLIMSFRRFYGLGETLHPSRLAEGPEEAYAPWRKSREARPW